MFKRLLPIFVFAIILASIVLAIYWYNYMPRAIGRLYTIDYNIASKRNALVNEILVDVGQKVSVGQTLVRLDTNVLTALLQNKKDALEVAKKRIPARKGELELRQEELRLKLDDNLIFRAIEIESARTALNEDTSILTVAQANLVGAEIDVKRYTGLAATGAVKQALLDTATTKRNALLNKIANYEKVVKADVASIILR